MNAFGMVSVLECDNKIYVKSGRSERFTKVLAALYVQILPFSEPLCLTLMCV